MFNFKSLKTIFKYDWTKIIADLSPKGNKTIIDKKDHDNVLSGAILALIGKIIFYVLTFQAMKLITDGIIDADKVFGFNFKSTFTANILIFIFPIIVLIYELAFYKKEQNSNIPLILSCGTLISAAYALYICFAWIYILFKSRMISLVGLLGVLIEMIGYLFIITGYFEFARKNKQKYIEDHREPEKEVLIKTSVIGVNDIALHTKKKCMKCNSDIEDNYKYCVECGEKIGP